MVDGEVVAVVAVAVRQHPQYWHSACRDVLVVDAPTFRPDQKTLNPKP